MKKILFTALMAVATLAAGAQTSDEVMAKYNEAGAKMQAREFASAITLFEEVLAMGQVAGDAVTETVQKAKDQHLPMLYVALASGLAKAENYDEAVPLLEKAMASNNPTWAGNAKKLAGQVFNAAAAKAWNAEDFVKSAELYAKAREVDPADSNAAIQLAESLGKAKDYDKSFGLFRELIAAGGDNVDALKSRLGFYMLLNANEAAENDAPKALEVLTEAVELDNNPQAWELLMNTAFNANNYDKLVEMGERAAEAQTDDVKKSNVYSQLGFAYEKKGNNAKAIEAYRKVTAGPNAANAKAQVTALQAQK
jgi:tetratricopeptide (TPR) repeat protein